MKTDNVCFKTIAVVGLAAAVVGLTGCDREQVQVYTTPKEAVAAGQPHLHWDLPSGWQEKPAGGMRAGSFSVRGTGGEEADVSIIPLPGDSGTDLDNVNRWRSQVGLEPISADQLKSVSEPVTIGGAEASMVDLAGTDPATKKPARILAATTKTDGTTWFIKMTGPDALVAEQKPAFRNFLKSLAIHAADAHAGHRAEPARATPATTAAPASGAPRAEVPPPVPPAAPATNPTANGLPQWEVPEGWREQPATTMLLAKFSVAGSGSEKAEVTVSAFPGDTGGLHANVNRWRRQIGLDPIGPDELTKVTSEIDVNGTKAVLVDMTNPSGSTAGLGNRVVVAVLPRSGQTWFFKMTGDSALIEKEKPAFIKFVQSVRFPNA